MIEAILFGNISVGRKKNKHHTSVTQALCAGEKDKLVYCYNNKKQTYAWLVGGWVVYKKRVECSFFFSGWVCECVYIRRVCVEECVNGI